MQQREEKELNHDSEVMLPLLEAALDCRIPDAVVAGAHEGAGAFVAGSAQSIADHGSLSDLASRRRHSAGRSIVAGAVAAARLAVLLQEVHVVAPPTVDAVPSCPHPMHTSDSFSFHIGAIHIYIANCTLYISDYL